MQVFAFVNHPSDEPFWIPREAFLAHFDQEEFVGNRAVRDVTQAYRRDWFKDGCGRLEFILPSVSYVKDKTQFINGRHRIAVLLQHMPELPIALATYQFSPRQLCLRAAIPSRTLDLSMPFELPGLPFLPDSGNIQEY